MPLASAQEVVAPGSSAGSPASGLGEVPCLVVDENTARCGNGRIVTRPAEHSEPAVAPPTGTDEPILEYFDYERVIPGGGVNGETCRVHGTLAVAPGETRDCSAMQVSSTSRGATRTARTRKHRLRHNPLPAMPSSTGGTFRCPRLLHTSRRGGRSRGCLPISRHGARRRTRTPSPTRRSGH